MQRLSDVSNIWKTIKEIDVTEIRERSEQPLQVALVAAPELRAALLRALQLSPSRYPAVGRPLLLEIEPAQARARQSDLRSSDVLLLALRPSELVAEELLGLREWLARQGTPLVTLLIGEAATFEPAALPGERPVHAVAATPAALAETLMPALVEALPDDLRVAAARQLPGLREAVARWLIGEVAFSNATFALSSGIPQLVPLLNIPLTAADIVVLTKNQVLMTYRLALAYGAPANFQAQLSELAPVIGGGFLWRQLARQLVGLIPMLGLVAKVAVAYAGTYVTGQVAAAWYRNGEVISGAALRQLHRQALVRGRHLARELIRRRRARADRPRLAPPADDATSAALPPSAPPTPRARWRRWFRRSKS